MVGYPCLASRPEVIIGDVSGRQRPGGRVVFVGEGGSLQRRDVGLQVAGMMESYFNPTSIVLSCNAWLRSHRGNGYHHPPGRGRTTETSKGFFPGLALPMPSC